MNDNANYYARTRAKREAVNEAEFGLGYLYATIENQLNQYTAQTGGTYSVAHVAFRLGRLLTSKALRVEPGLAELLSEVRERNSPALLGAADQLGGHVEPAEETVHVRSRAGRPLGSRRRLSAAARRAISIAQRKRWATAHRLDRAKKAGSNHRANNTQVGAWTPKQDEAIVNAIKLKGSPVDANEIARLLAGKVHRTQGGVRQRIHRMALRGILKETLSGKGRGAMSVEVP